MVTRYNFNDLEPSRSKLTTNSRIGSDNLSLSGYSLTNGDNLYIFLIPAVNHQTNLVLTKPPGGQMEAVWFNPFAGEYKDGGTRKYSMWAPYKSPWGNTWSALILKLK